MNDNGDDEFAISPWAALLWPVIGAFLLLKILAACTPQQAQQAQTAVTIACAVEATAVPVVITIATKPEDQGNVAKADAAAKAACAAMHGVAVTAATP